MNPDLDKLHLYPFQKFNALIADVQGESQHPMISWAMGEPKHPAPDFLVTALADSSMIRQGFGAYPPTRGIPELRQAIADFVERRFRLHRPLNIETEVLPVTGTREALFSIAQAVIDHGGSQTTLMPNPFYQIYEGAAVLAGSKPVYLNCDTSNGFIPDFQAVSSETWQQCRLIYICSPGNPTGSVMSTAQLRELIELSDEHDFVIASDECYSEIYRHESHPPPGLLQAASEMGRDDFRNCIAFNSLSKRSNVPGLRSGYVAGDAELLERYALYRTYQGAAMPVHHQLLSVMAWEDEQHVVENREAYRQKFDAVSRILDPVWSMEIPDAGFYLWPETPCSDTEFAVRLLRYANIKVLPGSYLSRDTRSGNPGADRVRMALVASGDECIEAAQRIRDNWTLLSA